MATRQESVESRETRFLLMELIRTTDRVLSLTFMGIRERGGKRLQDSITYLAVLYQDSASKLWRIFEQLQRPMTRMQIKGLMEISMFGDALEAKWALLVECLKEGMIQSTLKTLNSILGSLAKVFAPLHAVKEFKEMMEVAIDRLGPDVEPILIKFGQE